VNNRTKRRMKEKKGCGCAMCKPQKHGHSDARTLQEKRKDVDTAQQFDELPVDRVV